MEDEFIYVKDLRIFKNVNMKDMIIIDNSVLSFAFQLENGIPILPFYDNKDDIELKFLANYLGNIHSVKDLRIENNRSIKMLFLLKVTIKTMSVINLKIPLKLVFQIQNHLKMILILFIITIITI